MQGWNICRAPLLFPLPLDVNCGEPPYPSKAPGQDHNGDGNDLDGYEAEEGESDVLADFAQWEGAAGPARFPTPPPRIFLFTGVATTGSGEETYCCGTRGGEEEAVGFILLNDTVRKNVSEQATK